MIVGSHYLHIWVRFCVWDEFGETVMYTAKYSLFLIFIASSLMAEYITFQAYPQKLSSVIICLVISCWPWETLTIRATYNYRENMLGCIQVEVTAYVRI